MASPLSPSPTATLNFTTPPTARRSYEDYKVRTFTTAHTASTTRSSSHGADRRSSSSSNLEEGGDAVEGDSSPFISQVKDENQENATAPKLASRPTSRIMSGTELSPLKILQSRQPAPQQIDELLSSTSPPDSTSSGAGAGAGASASAGGDASSKQTTNLMMPPQGPRSPRKIVSPIRRFPVKVGTSFDDTPRAKPPQPQPQPQPERHISLDEAIRQNEDLKHAIDIFEDDASVLDGSGDGNSDNHGNNHDDAEEGDSVVTTVGARHGAQAGGMPVDAYEEEEIAGIDDTMVSTFSDFSAVPSMTMFAKFGRTPTATGAMLAGGGTPTPRAVRADLATPSRAQPRDGPLPNRTAHYDVGNTTNLLMDFTEQLRFAHQHQQSPSRPGGARLSPSKTTPNMAAAGGSVAATPKRQSLINLLDFDIPPLPTPRSIPTITPRELEGLKSGFLSEISSLRASLSGKEAEVLSLKAAVGDAEARVGECLERLREERGLREQLAEEKEGWERRGRDMEDVLRRVKEEIVVGQREREELEAKLDEAEKRREAAEMMAQEAESKMAGMRAARASAEAAAAAAASPDKPKGSPSAANTQREVELAVERMARELHAAYKTKHETKVAALKKSYEARWEKRVRQLEGSVEELTEENERLRVGRDATLTRVVPGGVADPQAERERQAKAARDAAQIRELAAEVDKLGAVVRTVQADNDELRGLLERERVEKGELVMLAEEMMSMQSFIATSSSAGNGGGGGGGGGGAPATPAPAATSAVSAVAAEERERPSTASSTSSGGNHPHLQHQRGSESATKKRSSATEGLGRRGSTGPGARSSGLKPPGAQSRIGRPGHEHKGSSAGSGSGGSAGLPRPGSGMGMRSGIMSSIEKMGNYRGRGE